MEKTLAWKEIMNVMMSSRTGNRDKRLDHSLVHFTLHEKCQVKGNSSFTNPKSLVSPCYGLGWKVPCLTLGWHNRVERRFQLHHLYWWSRELKASGQFALKPPCTFRCISLTLLFKFLYNLSWKTPWPTSTRHDHCTAKSPLPPRDLLESCSHFTK